MFSSSPVFLRVPLLAFLIGLVSAGAYANERPDGVRFLPDVPGQFRALTERPDTLGFHIGDSPNPSSCRHYQGITRVDAADGTPYFLVSRSGNTPEIPGPNELLCDDSPGETRHGNLIVFRAGSRDKNGERIRGNRLAKGAHINNTAPPSEDRAVKYFSVVDGSLGGLIPEDGEGVVPRIYGHPGGMQLVGKMLALAVEEPRQYPHGCAACFILANPPPECDICFTYDAAPNPALIMFFDVSDPENPVFKSQFAPYNEAGDPLSKAGVVGVTPLPGGLYLMVTTGGDNEDFYFYRSTVDDLSRPDLSWDFVARTDGPSVQDAHQTLQFLREGDINGPLYLAGARGRILSSDRDRIDLYRVECDTPDCAPGENVSLTVRFNGQRITPFPSTGGKELLSLAAASGFHITPSLELLFYATEHDNDGPSGTVKAGEWRHEDMAREGSPLMLPTADVNGPYEVDEGSSVLLSGSAAPPIMKPWIQLFHGTDFESYYPVVDFDDHDLDDFDDFFNLEPQFFPPPLLPFTHNDKARSWTWFAPVGCSILVVDHDGDGDVDETRTLVGTGAAEGDADLSLVLNDEGTDDMDQEIDAVDFLGDCDTYYATPVDLEWDLDGNGSYETTAYSVVFDAGVLDGPDEVGVPARAQHPAGGAPSETVVAKIVIRNVAPMVSPLTLTDGAGNEVNVDVPFVLVGLPVTLSASFEDPGLPDHQSAVIDWGDGAVENESVFAIFDEAFGDGIGEVVHAHTYAIPGTYGIDLDVTDDDGGVGNASAVVDVLSAEQATEAIIDLLDDIIAATNDQRILMYLGMARRALTGNPGAQDGALNKIQNDLDDAAIAFLEVAIDWLENAADDGADVETLIALLEQVVAALSTP